jgi:hypothetical protein
MKIKENDLIRIDFTDEETGEQLDIIVEVVQMMDKIMVKEPDNRSYLDGGHRPFLIDGDEVIEVVEPAEERS